MTSCLEYSPNNVFQRFRVVEFPATFTGLYTTMYLEIDVDLNTTAYLKTLCEGRLMRLEEAKEISASHRAFQITQIDNYTLKINFKPTTECISKAKRKPNFTDRFVIDIHLLRAHSTRCCNEEKHAEIGRYYIAGQFEYCQITHFPKIIDYGEMLINSKITKVVELRNNSTLISAKVIYVKVTGFEVVPSTFTLTPSTTKKFYISLRPCSINVAKHVSFKITNANDMFNDVESEVSDNEDNFIIYNILVECKASYQRYTKVCFIESLHKLYEKNLCYTYSDAELITKCKQKKQALNFLHNMYTTIAPKEREPKNTCTDCKVNYCEIGITETKLSSNFCKIINRARISIYDLFDVTFYPTFLNFGRVTLSTWGESELKIKNSSKYEVFIILLKDEAITYTERKKHTLTLKIPPFDEQRITICCLGFVEGSYRGTFPYAIENKYFLQYPYTLQVGNPTLMLKDKTLKFGMATVENFITAQPVYIYNNFNTPIEFKWDELESDVPFSIIPKTGLIKSHTCRICDVQYVCKPTKTKIHEIDFISCGKMKKIIPVELNVITRKHSIKFLQPTVAFKDIPLNLEVTDKVKLENSSKEYAVFQVVEPLMHGFSIEPMNGIIKPKMIVVLKLKVKIPCVLEFLYDLNVKINNRETLILVISGNVVEPRLTVYPRNIYMARIPCNMVTYVPVLIKNVGTVKSLIRILDTGDTCVKMFNVYVTKGNEKERVSEFFIDGGESLTVYIKVYDIFRREYDMYLPFQINDLLGPPEKNSWSLDLQYYTVSYEKFYDSNPKNKLKHINRDISYCRISGVITLPWIQFSVEKFQFDQEDPENNTMEFTMTNISKYILPVTIITSKLFPNFTLTLVSEDFLSITETCIKLELTCWSSATFLLKFHPVGNSRYVAVALLYLDKLMAIPYYDLTFVGKSELPTLIPSKYRLIYPPCSIGTTVSQFVDLTVDGIEMFESFSYESTDKNIAVDFIEIQKFEHLDIIQTIVTAEISIRCENTYIGNTTIQFSHQNEATCDVEICYCFSSCALTLHATTFVKPFDNPFPYYPSGDQSVLYNYMNFCSEFLEKWLFQQGFRRDFFPIIPNSFHAISTSMTSQQGASKLTKGLNVSYLNFVRRVAGPLMKHIKKIIVTDLNEDFKYVKEIHDTYKEIIHLLKSREANIWILKAKFLLSYDQFVIYCQNVTETKKADLRITEILLNDVELFERLNKQCWIDFILQTYKVFIVDSCFFDCVCVSLDKRDIVKIIINWFNNEIQAQYYTLVPKDKRKSRTVKHLSNLTTDLSDGIAFASVILNHCPFMKGHFSVFHEIDETNRVGYIIHNACLIIEAMNILKLYFPLNSSDLLQPNFLQMLFLSIHLYVVLPTFTPREVIKFNPPLTRSSTRLVSVSPLHQESLVFNYFILNNLYNAFTAEKSISVENSKKVILNVKYQANFVKEIKSTLIVQGYNKTRIFDTYIVFYLKGCVGSLIPFKKCKVVCPIYRPNRADVLVASPYYEGSDYNVYILDVEPAIPVQIDESSKPKFFVRRLNIMDDVIRLEGMPKEPSQEEMEFKLNLQMICLSSQVGHTWIWFKSEIGEFFIKVTTQPRWDLALEFLDAKLSKWPLHACSCGEYCECYRSTVVFIPHKNELKVKGLRNALLENASEIMMSIFDQLIDSMTGKLILSMLFEEYGTDMSHINHVFKSNITYHVTSHSLKPRLDQVKISQYSDEILTLPITIPRDSKTEKYSVSLQSECGMDIRVYRVSFTEYHMCNE